GTSTFGRHGADRRSAGERMQTRGRAATIPAGAGPARLPRFHPPVRAGSASVRGTPKCLLATCPAGAETAVTQGIAPVWPVFPLAYSRPGFVAFNVPAGAVPPDDLDLQSAFARAYGLSLGKASGGTVDERIRQVRELLENLPVSDLHV